MPGRTTASSLLILVAALWVSRGAFVALMPADARSKDVRHWEIVADELRAGRNPYESTTHVNWPPLIVGMILALDRISSATGVSLFRLLQGLLILVETAVLLVAAGTIRQFASSSTCSRVLLAGIALNPVAILLCCQHCNFDLLVALWIVCFVAAEAMLEKSALPRHWMLACFFLGLAICTKTAPFVLLPVLLWKSKRFRWSVLSTGWMMAIAPAAIGIGAMYLLAPQGVIDHVLRYRSEPGWFGISGLLGLLGFDWIWKPLATSFLIGLLIVELLACRFVVKEPAPDSHKLLLLCALLLMILPVLGPGYAPQYASWFLPLLAITYPLFGRRWRAMLVVLLVVGSLTYLIEYALLPSHGAFLAAIFHGDAPARWGKALSSERSQTLLRLPLFFSYLSVLVAGLFLLKRVGTRCA